MKRYATSKFSQVKRLMTLSCFIAFSSYSFANENSAGRREIPGTESNEALRLTTHIKERLAKLDTVINQGLSAPVGDSPAANKPKNTTEADPWSDIHNLQFYLWRSFAFDPQGIRPLHPIEGPSISATEITEDLDNRFLLVKGATWPEALGLAPVFNDYIALCQEIIDFRKKRLYSDAKSIAKRGDLDEVYHRLIDAIEQVQGSDASTSTMTGAAKTSASVKPALGEASNLVKNLQSEIDVLVKVTAETTYTKSPRFVEETLPQNSTTIGWDAALAFMNSTTPDKFFQEAHELMRKPWDSTQTLIMLVATLSLALLILFLVGITRHAGLKVIPSSEQKDIKTTRIAIPEVSSYTPSIEPIAQPETIRILDSAAQARIAAVMRVLEDEETLSDMVALLSGEQEADLGTSQADLQWLATELDDLKSACHSATEQCDVRVLSGHINHLAMSQMGDSKRQANTPRQAVRDFLVAKLKNALTSIAPRHETKNAA